MGKISSFFGLPNIGSLVNIKWNSNLKIHQQLTEFEIRVSPPNLVLNLGNMKRVVCRLLDNNHRLSLLLKRGSCCGNVCDRLSFENELRNDSVSPYYMDNKIQRGLVLNTYQIRKYDGFSQRFKNMKDSSRKNEYRTQFGYNGGEKEFDIILVILVVNGIVYLIFSLMTDEEKRKYRSRYAASLKNLREGKLYCLLTSNFVHADFFHFAINAFVFYSFGRPLSIVVGRQRFIRLLALSSIMSPLSYLGEKYFYFRKEPTVAGKAFHFMSSGCGLSGVTMAIVTSACILMPHQSVLLYFVIPMNLRIAWFGIMGYDIYSIFKKKWRNRIASSAHLGGAATAIFLYRSFLSNLFLPF